MTPQQNAIQSPNQLTEHELRAIAYFAIGIGSEGGFGGRDVSHRLSFAGNIRNGVMRPVGNSGYSIGTLQTDLGQHPAVAGELVSAFQLWAHRQQPSWVLSVAAQRQLTADLARTGKAIKDDDGRAPDGEAMEHLNAYLRSEDGVSFVHDRDEAQVDRLITGIARRLQATDLYQQADRDDQVRLAAVVMKLQNQSGDLWTPRLLRSMDDGGLDSVAAVNSAIDTFRKEDIRRDYIESGRVHTSHAAEVLVALRNADPRSPLSDAWRAVVADPLVNPTQLDRQPGQPDLPHQYTAVKNLFLQPAQAPRLIAALDEGGAYAWGRPQSENGNPPTAGLYASGNDLVLWNLEGHGARHVDGAWSAVSRDDLSRARHRNGVVDLFEDAERHTRTLLHVDPAAPVLRPAGTDARRIGVDRGEPAMPSLSTSDAPRASSGHPLLEQARAGVQRLDRDLGRTPDDASERMSASLALLAQSRGLTRIDHVVLSAQTDALARGANVFVIQGHPDDPSSRVGHMRTQDAVAAPVEASLVQLDVGARQSAPAGRASEPVQVEREPARMSVG
ncbi:MAG: hypothetical protein A2579_02965 [Lysobacterales bacterium RIFOXYD1_FULL_69_11]|nr:MAG: hypothetical protein A2190_01815 [Xanthomonadales bacterium RIFOXYA1_FULL_69_10]OHE86563.1 MAG: hypothetical protein A2579_02965 [Xanthomonadales bacterium RIFOXYD1_FULL_69_11]